MSPAAAVFRNTLQAFVEPTAELIPGWVLVQSEIILRFSAPYFGTVRRGAEVASDHSSERGPHDVAGEEAEVVDLICREFVPFLAHESLVLFGQV